MFKLGNFKSNSLTGRHFGVTFRAFAPELPYFDGINPVLKLKSKNGLFSLDYKIGEHVFKDVGSVFTAKNNRVNGSPLWIMLGFDSGMQTASNGGLDGFHNGLVRHADGKVKAVPFVKAIGFFPVGNTNTSLSVKNTCDVSNAQHDSSYGVLAEKMANSVDIRCPARKGAEGQYRAKQGESLGVCNEQVPFSKEKICSDLGRDAESAAEMTAPYNKYFIHDEIHYTVTTCDSKYLKFYTHKDRNFEQFGGQRESINQDATVRAIGWAGNMTTSAPSLQGVLFDSVNP